MAQSETERILERMGVGDDQGWEWFDADAATAPDRDTTPQEARKHWDDPEWLREQYVERRMPATAIAAQIGNSPSAVRSALQRHGIDRRGTAPQASDAATRRYDREELIAALWTATAELGHVPTVVEYQAWHHKTADGWPTDSTITRRLGAGGYWDTALAAAGLLDEENDE